MTIFDKGLYTVLACCALFVLVSIPLALRMVPRNPVYGYRTRSSMANDEIWYSANAYFARALIAASSVAAAAAYAIDLTRPFHSPDFLPVTVVLIAAPGVIAALATGRFLRLSQQR